MAVTADSRARTAATRCVHHSAVAVDDVVVGAVRVADDALRAGFVVGATGGAAAVVESAVAHAGSSGESIRFAGSNTDAAAVAGGSPAVGLQFGSHSLVRAEVQDERAEACAEVAAPKGQGAFRSTL